MVYKVFEITFKFCISEINDRFWSIRAIIVSQLFYEGRESDFKTLHQKRLKFLPVFGQCHLIHLSEIVICKPLSQYWMLLQSSQRRLWFYWPSLGQMTSVHLKEWWLSNKDVLLSCYELGTKNQFWFPLKNWTSDLQSAVKCIQQYTLWLSCQYLQAPSQRCFEITAH